MEDLDIGAEPHAVEANSASMALQVIAPVGALPFELLARIFLLCHARMSFYRHRTLRQRGSHGYEPWAASPMVFCQVCVQWRQVAISVPQLWNPVVLNLKNEPDPTLQNILQDAATQLARAGPSVVLRLHNTHSANMQMPARHIAGVLKPYLHFVRHLQLHNIAYPYMCELFSQSSPSPIMMDCVLWPHLINLLPNITYRYISQFLPQSSPPSMEGVLWSHLTSLLVDSTPLALLSAREVLAQCNNLVTCVLAISPDESAPDKPTSSVDPVTLASLKSLDLNLSDHVRDYCGHSRPSFFTHFFAAFTLPALKDLMVQLKGSNQDLDDAVMQFKQRSALDLEQLTLSHTHITSVRLVAFLEGMSSLSALRITHAHKCVDDGLFKAFTIGRSPQLAPNTIKTLTIDHSGLDGLGDVLNKEVIFDMLESRCTTGESAILMKNISIHCGTYKTLRKGQKWWEGIHNANKRMDECSAKGMRIDFQYHRRYYYHSDENGDWVPVPSSDEEDSDSEADSYDYLGVTEDLDH